MSQRSVIQFIKPCRHPGKVHQELTAAHAYAMIRQRKVIQINLDNCSLQRMEELPLNPTREDANAVGLLPLVDFLNSAPAVALTAMGIQEMPDMHVANARQAYERFCAAFWPNHKNDIEATYRKFDKKSKEQRVEFTRLSEGARTTYGSAYVALLLMQHIQISYSELTPEDKFEAYLYSMIEMLDLLSAFEIEIAKYAFWDISEIDINGLPEGIRIRRRDIKENFTKLPTTVRSCKRVAFNGAMDLHWLSGANLSEDLGATINTEVGELTVDIWVGTNDLKLFRICRDLHSVPSEDSKMMYFNPTREPELQALSYWRDVDLISRKVMSERKNSGHRSLDNSLLLKIDIAVDYLEGELRKSLED